MDALETAKWECYMQPFYRDLPNIRGIGRTLHYYAQNLSCMHAGAKRQAIPQHPTMAVAAYHAASYWPDQTALYYVAMAGLP
jgi:hypothetical protein